MSLVLQSAQSLSSVWPMAAILIWLCIHILWYLALHPLAKVPGPKWAALTSLHQVYYDGVRYSAFYDKIRQWHLQYGPIVRIGPREVHIADPDFFHDFHTSTPELDKDDNFYNAPTALVTVTDHRQHEHWRKSIERWYTPTAATLMEDRLHLTLTGLCRRLVTASDSGSPVNLSHALRPWSFDAMSLVYLGHDPGLRLREDYGRDINLAYRGFTRFYSFLRHLPFAKAVLRLANFAHARTNILPYRMRLWAKFETVILERARHVHANRDSWTKQGEGILHHILQDQPGKDLTSLQYDIVGNILAGTEAVANALLTIFFHLAGRRELRERLQNELVDVPTGENGVVSYKALCRLPFLKAVVQEGLRLQKGSEFREPRVCRSREVVFREWTIPRGTIISTTPQSVHQDASIFRDPMRFEPDRWLEESKIPLHRYLVPFSKGRRQCLGQHYARMMLYIAVAGIYKHVQPEWRLLGPEQSMPEALGLFPPISAQDIVVEDVPTASKVGPA